AAAVEEMIERDLPQAMQLLNEMNQSIDSVTKLVDNMLSQVKKGEMSTDSGLSFLEMKYHMLLSYLINITYVVLRKVSGNKIEGDPAIDRLVEIRTVLERIRPIDHKLKYQIDKLVKAAVTGKTDDNDPSQFRANPENFANKLGESDGGSGSSDDSDDEKSESKDKKKSGVYVPPKLAAVHYDGDETTVSRQQKQLERAKKRALQSSVMQELREEYMDTPTEISQASATQTVLSRQHREREEYEETYFTRLPVSKQQKHKSRRLTTLGTLGDDLTRFGDISVLEGGPGTSMPSKKRKASASKGKKKGKKRKFH
ncbi:Neuroguidin, partial [Frankliniella fusca]